MSNFAALKKNRRSVDDIAQQAKEAYSNKKSYDDDDFWGLEVDKNGNGQAIIRFLPAKDIEKLAWIKWFSYGFRNPKNGQWYIEKSPTTNGDPDPVAEYASKLWNSGEDGKKQIRRSPKEGGIKRRQNYAAYIQIIDHQHKPEDNGKIMKFRFGAKIFEKIMNALSPEFEGDDPVNVFDFWEGANFKLRRRQVDGWANYDQSVFDSPSELVGGDETKLEEIFNSLEDIHEFIAPEKFKSYDELLAKFNRVMGISASTVNQTEKVDVEEERPFDSETEESETPETEVEGEAGEDQMAYFRNLANED